MSQGLEHFMNRKSKFVQQSPLPKEILENKAKPWVGGSGSSGEKENPRGINSEKQTSVCQLGSL